MLNKIIYEIKLFYYSRLIKKFLIFKNYLTSQKFLIIKIINNEKVYTMESVSYTHLTPNPIHIAYA